MDRLNPVAFAIGFTATVVGIVLRELEQPRKTAHDNRWRKFLDEHPDVIWRWPPDAP